jgi:hypothetical protein
MFPNDPTWATFRYWNRDVITGHFKKVEFMIANNGEMPLYQDNKYFRAVFAAAEPLKFPSSM